jgi:ADP-ribose pyrophosphatase YjhB (NUDIX family)
MAKVLRFYLKVFLRAARDKHFRAHALAEFWVVLRQYLPARLVTRRRDYVFCRYLSSPLENPKGRWLPPVGLGYRLAAYGILFDEQGRVLMGCDRKMDFGWNLPGGGVNKDETLEQGLVREFEEETGLLVKSIQVVANEDNYCIMPTGRAIHGVLHYYLVEVVGGELLADGNGFDTSRVDFVDLDAIPQSEVVDYKVARPIIEKARWLYKSINFIKTS